MLLEHVMHGCAASITHLCADDLAPCMISLTISLYDLPHDLPL